MVMMQPRLVLASNSPRRRQLLALGEWTFVVLPANIDESQLPGEAPQAYVLRLAEGKARVAAEYARAGELVVAADTIVVDSPNQGAQPLVLGKPADPAEAFAILRGLRGHCHSVFTALAVFSPADGRLLTDLCATQVPMREYTDQEIQAYVDSGDPLDKAGAYAIQHPGFHPVDGLQGCYASVMGLPLCHLVRTLKKFGVAGGNGVPQACQALLQYACPIYADVLAGGTSG